MTWFNKRDEFGELSKGDVNLILELWNGTSYRIYHQEDIWVESDKKGRESTENKDKEKCRVPQIDGK